MIIVEGLWKEWCIGSSCILKIITFLKLLVYPAVSVPEKLPVLEVKLILEYIQGCWMLAQNYVARNVKGTWSLYHNTAACTYDIILLLVVLKILFSFQRMIFLDCNKSCLNCKSQLGRQTIRLNFMQCCVSSRILNKII